MGACETALPRKLALSDQLMSTLRPVRTTALALFVLTLLSACGDSTTADIRYSTPEHTVRTLLDSYGLRGRSADEIRTMRRERQLRLQDPPAYRGCFLRLEGLGDEALAGFVVGALAENSGDLRTQIAAETARVSVGQRATLVMRLRDGAWRIDLDASVPSAIREQLREVARRAQEQQRRQGALPAQ
jgi:hypothetical protein